MLDFMSAHSTPPRSHSPCPQHPLRHLLPLANDWSSTLKRPMVRMMRDHLLAIEGVRETVRVNGEGKERVNDMRREERELL